MEEAKGNQVNVFYHVTKGCLIWIDGNNEIVEAINNRNFNEELYFMHPELGGMDVTNRVKNLIPATAKNIRAANESINKLESRLSALAPQLDASTYSANEWNCQVQYKEPLMRKIRNNSVSFTEYLSQVNKIKKNVLG